MNASFACAALIASGLYLSVFAASPAAQKSGEARPAGLPVPEGAGPRNRVFLAPRGGYAFVNYSKKTEMVNPRTGEVSLAPGDLSNPTVNMIKNAKKTVDVASYIFKKDTPTFRALLGAAYRGVKVRLFLDSLFLDKYMIKDFEKYHTPLEAKTLDAEKAEKLTGIPFTTMHEKFGIIDGRSVFNGSSNISLPASTKYAESRFFFENNPAMARVFQEEFDRLWSMGKWLYRPEAKKSDNEKNRRKK